jgi:hypothetical protein
MLVSQMNKTTEKLMVYKYERKRIKKIVKMPPLCPDYDPVDYGDWCKKAKLCKNATYGGNRDKAEGVCFGGTSQEERKDRFADGKFDQMLGELRTITSQPAGTRLPVHA